MRTKLPTYLNDILLFVIKYLIFFFALKLDFNIKQWLVNLLCKYVTIKTLLKNAY